MKLIFEKKFYTSAGEIKAGIMLVLAISSIATTGVLFTYSRGPSDDNTVVFILGIVSVFLIIMCKRAFNRAKVWIKIYKKSKREWQIIIEDPREKKTIESPWELEYGYEIVFVSPQAPKQKRLKLNLYQDDQVVLRMNVDYGFLLDPPHGWPKKYDHFRPDSTPCKYKHVNYAGEGLEEIVKLLR